MSLTDTDPQDIVEAPAKARGRGWVKGLLLVVLLGGAGAGGAWYMGWIFPQDVGEQAAVVEAPLIYFDVDSNMVVNFQGGGRMRYLQVGVQIATRDPDVVAALKTHHPALRDALIILLSEQSYDSISTRAGKDALRDAALTAVQDVMQERYGAPAVESLYFTSFVMQ